jgi:hypothetical protein
LLGVMVIFILPKIDQHAYLLLLLKLRTSSLKKWELLY